MSCTHHRRIWHPRALEHGLCRKLNELIFKCLTFPYFESILWQLRPGLGNCVWIYLSVCNIPLHLMLSLMEGFNLLFWNNRTISEGQIPSESGRCCEGTPFYPLCHRVSYASVLLFCWENCHRTFNSEKIISCRERVQTWAINKIHCTVLHFCGFIPHLFRHFIAWDAWSRSVVALGSLCSGGMQVNTSRD